MKQEQVRPVRHTRTSPHQNEDNRGEDLWPLSAKEFLKPPRVAEARKSLRYRVEESKEDQAQS
jgi:hypothetical protein